MAQRRRHGARTAVRRGTPPPGKRSLTRLGTGHEVRRREEPKPDRGGAGRSQPTGDDQPSDSYPSCSAARLRLVTRLLPVPLALVVISELQCAHLLARYIASPPRRAAWWRRSSTSAMSSICSGRGAAYRAVVRRSTCPSRAETVCTDTPASRHWVAQ